MSTHFVLTLSGPDRIGIVDEVTGLLLERGGNVETSRMTRLGGEFAVLMLVTMAEERFATLEQGLSGLIAEGYKVTTSPARKSYDEAYRGWKPYRIEVHGADNEGIIHQVAHFLSERGISIESAESEATLAPTSGSPLFAMAAQVIAPPGLDGSGWEDALHELGTRLNLDVAIFALPSA